MGTLLFKAVILRKARDVQKVMQNRQNVKNSLPTEYLCRTSKGLYLDKNRYILWRLLYWFRRCCTIVAWLVQLVWLILSVYALNICVIFVWFFQKRVVKNISLLSLVYMMFSEKEICEMIPLIPPSEKVSLLFSQKYKDCCRYGCDSTEMKISFFLK